MKNVLIILICLIAFIGCRPGGRKFDESKLNQIKIGETTSVQVDQAMGVADEVSRDVQGNVSNSYIYSISGSITQKVVIAMGRDGMVKNIIKPVQSAK